MQKNLQEIQSKAIARAWRDPAFKKNLLESPAKMLRELGFEFDDKTKVIAEECAEKEFYITLPHRPVDIAPLSDKDIHDCSPSSCPDQSCAYQSTQ